VAVVNAIAEGRVQVMPEVLVNGGGGSIDGLAASLIQFLRNGNGHVAAAEVKASAKLPAADPPNA
jgi:hypothetical protein